jgi:hypothetical protein
MEFEVASDTLHEFLHVERDTIISFLASCEKARSKRPGARPRTVPRHEGRLFIFSSGDALITDGLYRFLTTDPNR